MSQQEWQQLNLALHLEPCSDGMKQEKLKQSKRPKVNDDTTSIQLSLFDSPIDQQSFRLEFPAILKNLILKDKFSFLSLSTPVAPSSKMSDRDSTLSEKGYLPYWNEFCQAMSEWWSLLTLTDFADSGSHLFHGSQAVTGVKLWFSTTMFLAQSEKCLRMFLPSSMSSVANFTDSGNTSRKLKKTLTYRVYPTGKTKETWMLRIHAYRKVYNNAIAYLNQHQGFTYTNRKGEIRTSGKKEFRSFCKTLGSEIIPQWCKDLSLHN